MTYKCKFCKRDFVRESTLASHTCENKRRVFDKDLKQNRIAYQAWLLWRRLSLANIKTDKTYEEFATNKNYVGFMRLANYVIDLNIDKPENYVKFIVKNSVPIAKWTSDTVYEAFIKDKIKKETVERAIERSILNMKAWADSTGSNYTDYFLKVAPAIAVQDIRMGRISPWCTFATDQGGRLVDRLEEKQIQALLDYLDYKSWRAMVLRQRNDAEWVQQVFNEAEIK